MGNVDAAASGLAVLGQPVLADVVAPEVECCCVAPNDLGFRFEADGMAALSFEANELTQLSSPTILNFVPVVGPRGGRP